MMVYVYSTVQATHKTAAEREVRQTADTAAAGSSSSTEEAAAVSSQSEHAQKMLLLFSLLALTVKNKEVRHRHRPTLTSAYSIFAPLSMFCRHNYPEIRLLKIINMELPEALVAVILSYTSGRFLKSWVSYNMSPECRAELELALRFRLVCKAWNDVICASCEEIQLLSVPRLLTAPDVTASFSMSFPKLRRLVLLHHFYKEWSMLSCPEAEQNPVKLPAYIPLNDIFNKTLSCPRVNCNRFSLQVRVSGIVNDDDSPRIRMFHFSMIHSILTNCQNFALSNNCIDRFDLSDNAALQDSDVRQIFFSSVQVQELFLNNCTNLIEPIVMARLQTGNTERSNVSHVYLDGSWNISESNLTAFKDVMEIDMLGDKPISEVVILQGAYTGSWVKCSELRKLLPAALDSTETLPRYDIFVHSTNRYAFALGFSGKEAHNISRKHLR